MKQVKVNNILYVMDTEAYAITADTDASIIYVPEDYYDDYVALNSGLTLTKYNYGVIRVTKPEYDVPEPPTPPTPTKETRLVITYDVQSTAQPTQLYSLGSGQQPVFGAEDFSAIEIDGSDVSVETIDGTYGTYQFTSTGEHTVKYTLEGNSINENRFSNNGRLGIASIYIPSTLTSLESYTFDTNYCDSIIIDEDNTQYTSNGEIGNCIVDKTTNTLITVSNNTVIPNDVVTIADYVGGYSGIENLVIPNSVTTIGEECFMSSLSLTSLTIGSGVSTWGDNAFSDCESITTVTIVGTNDMTETIPYNFWQYSMTTLYVDSSLVSTYQEFLSDDYSNIEVLAIE